MHCLIYRTSLEPAPDIELSLIRTYLKTPAGKTQSNPLIRIVNKYKLIPSGCGTQHSAQDLCETIILTHLLEMASLST